MSKRQSLRERLGQNRTILKEKINESLSSVLPITGLVLLLSFSVAPIPTSALMAFLIGALLLIVGMGLFTLGAETAMLPIGERVGAHMTKTRKLAIVVAVSFLMGVIITISEPDLTVLANQVPTIPKALLIGAVAVGVGLFLVLALLRILFRISLRKLLIGFYIAVFILACFVPEEFLAIAFDAGGVTTGPMTVPFIMALGLGVASIRSDSDAGKDSFGLIALCSIGPILAVLILSLIFHADAGIYHPVQIPDAQDSRALWRLFDHGFPEYIKEVAVSLAPIAAFFAVFQIVSLRMKRKTVLRIIVGIAYTYFGLVLFLTGVNVGFMPAGNYLGAQIARLPYNWIIVPIGMLMGYFIVNAEPAVHVLNKQVEEITAGAIPGKAMLTSLSVGVAVSIGLAMIRVLTGISIFWFLVPGYLAAVAMAFFAPRIFTSIAFDSGGVASGPMTATFLLPFAMGACDALGGNIVTDAFGVVSMVAMTPLITIQLMGLLYQRRLSAMGRAEPKAAEAVPVPEPAIAAEAAAEAPAEAAEQAAEYAPAIDIDDEIIEF